MFLTEEQQMLRQMVREFADNEVAPLAETIDAEERFPHETIEKMAELGLLGICYPEEYGGAGMDNLSYIIAVEELSRVCASTGITLAAHISLGVGPISLFGTEEQKQKFMPALCSGERLGAFGLTEPNAGSDAGGTETTAVLDGDEWVLNGSKIYCTNGSVAGTIVCTAVTDRDKGSHGISSFIVESDNPGFRVGKKEKKLGIRASDTVMVHFEDCRIPKDNILGTPGEGFKQFLITLDGGRISIGAMALGIAQGAMERAVQYSQERVQFGKPIAAFQSIQHKLANMATEIEAARHLVYHASRLKDKGMKFSRQSAMAKLFASEVATRTANEAIQVHGGYGYVREYHVERMFRDAKLTEIGEGTSEIQRLVIARSLMDSFGK
ncbi:acyl-CoA dehydrogenase [bacterium]|nr:acyl-CoA dehydrogenase [bacterium]